MVKKPKWSEEWKTRSPNESLVFLYVLDVEMTNISSFKLLLNYDIINM